MYNSIQTLSVYLVIRGVRLHVNTEYLTNLCSLCDDQRLRSSVRGYFVVRRTRTRLANSSFTVAGPAAWNLLPVSIRNTNSHSAFCRQLKTYLFSTPDWLPYLCSLHCVYSVLSVRRCWAPVEWRHSKLLWWRWWWWQTVIGDMMMGQHLMLFWQKNLFWIYETMLHFTSTIIFVSFILFCSRQQVRQRLQWRQCQHQHNHLWVLMCCYLSDWVIGCSAIERHHTVFLPDLLTLLFP